ncbi:peptidylprolyl isomerase [Polynucleobacter sp. 86C-FISCH]|uniref:peptidylprolyl isomerase n=1 Tax=Polynucleobacter sp. 86C-FISCH TaxID=2689101 RepID=UPI001C0D1C55|nr:peptidylprolyl isomerase [Polynucleobacter sp. 86C-FISCH]MBU3595141.1 peptidylprolyl isomerase [Polynucleobacter sp. 86C-FISCH]
MKLFTKQTFVAIFSIFIFGSANSQPAKTLVTINGVKITSTQLDQWVSVAVSEGAKDTPELRQGVLNDLILREAINQEVKKSGLLSKGNNAFKVKLAEQNAIVDLWFAQYFLQNPVTNEDVRAVYDKQVELSKDPKNAKEYFVAQIVVANEAEGIALINQINGGASFEELAKTRSLDKVSGQQGGVVGWVLSSQLTPPVNDIVPNLAKGKITQSPVKTANGWHVIKVEDIKPFVLPSFDQAKNAIAQSLIQQRRQEAVNALTKGFKINQEK